MARLRWRAVRPAVPELGLMTAFTAISLVTLLSGWVLEAVRGFQTASLVLFLIAYVTGGAFPVRAAVAAALQRRVDVNVLMLSAAIGAAALGFWQEGAVLMFLFALSGTLESFAVFRTRRAVEAEIAPHLPQATYLVPEGHSDVL